MRNYVVMAVVLFILGACSVLPAGRNMVPRAVVAKSEALWLHATDETSGAQSLLAVQFSDEKGWRWVQTDALGAPIARQYSDGMSWHNDGFLPPNRAASRLFSAVAVVAAQYLRLPVAAVYPDVQVQTAGSAGNEMFVRNKKGNLLWKITRLSPEKWQIDGGADFRWTVERVAP